MKKLLIALFFFISCSAKAQTTTFAADLGTHTTSFTGTMQTNNVPYHGVYLMISLGTVSGTTPTLAVQFQWSPDGGVTWINVGPAMANLTTSTTNGIILLYPAGLASGGGAGTALTTGGATTLLLNMALPQYWRLNYTIGGTTPSFAIGAIQASYIY